MIRPRLIARVIGALMVMVALPMLLPWGIALYDGKGEQLCFLLPMAATVPLGLLFFFLIKQEENVELSHREAFLIAALGWIFAALVVSLPYWIFGGWMPHPPGKSPFPNFTMAYYESMSGLTTTGATILNDIEALPRSMLFWRCMSHWLGGMGILLLGVAILPFLGVGGMELYKAEVPGPTKDKLRPRVAQTAKSLWFIYFLLTVVQMVFLKAGGMSMFDSICHAFSTIATGGFSTRGISVEAYNSVYFEMVIVFFMFLAGTNFALHYAWMKGDFKSLYRDEEFRFYGMAILLFSIGIAYALTISGYYKGFFTAMRYAVFQVVAIITSTGFSSCNFDDWWIHAAGNGAHASIPAIFLLLTLFFLGGSAGSTGGGVKCIRIYLLFKTAYREFIRLIHPNVVRPIKLNGRVVPEGVITSIIGFFILYLVIIVAFSFCMTLFGLDLLSSFTAVASSIGNIGPGVLKVGPYKNFSGIPELGQWILIFCMLLGRLEIYTVLVLLLPSFWRD